MRRTRWGTIATIAFLLWPHPLHPQVVDCIVAEVNGKAMTLTDVRILQEFGLSPEGGNGVTPLTLRQVLEEAIDRRVVIGLVREDIDVTQEEVDDLLARWKGRFEVGHWQEKLTAYGLQEKGLRPYIEEVVRYVKTIDLRFGRGVEIDPQEIDRYYEDVYVPSERVAGREPSPMPKVQAEIEIRIRSEKARQQSVAWIRSLRGQAEVRINEGCLEQAK